MEKFDKLFFGLVVPIMIIIQIAFLSGCGYLIYLGIKLLIKLSS